MHNEEERSINSIVLHQNQIRIKGLMNEGLEEVVQLVGSYDCTI